MKSKTFVKKTRSGGIMKIVREHYLRDDIWCGSEVCTECKQEETVLQKDACIESNLCSFPHYLLPDTNIVLSQVSYCAIMSNVNVVIINNKSIQKKYMSKVIARFSHRITTVLDV